MKESPVSVAVAIARILLTDPGSTSAQLVVALKERTLGEISCSQEHVIKTLHRMLDSGMVVQQWSDPKSGIPWHLTDAGRALAKRQLEVMRRLEKDE